MYETYSFVYLSRLYFATKKIYKNESLHLLMREVRIVALFLFVPLCEKIERERKRERGRKREIKKTNKCKRKNKFFLNIRKI